MTTLKNYIVELMDATRHHNDLVLGGSPRASLALFKASQALAAIRGRDYVIPDDIHYLLPVIIPHRLIVAPEAELRGFSSKGILQSIVEKIPLPVVKQPQ